jgi:hypothetical protein
MPLFHFPEGEVVTPYSVEERGLARGPQEASYWESGGTATFGLSSKAPTVSLVPDGHTRLSQESLQ